jgi:hypothetical protein
MSIRVDPTEFACTFCRSAGAVWPLVRSMHGLYCTNEACYTRVTGGNLVPPVGCDACGENAFYVETADEPESGSYRCIACGKTTPVR